MNRSMNELTHQFNYSEQHSVWNLEDSHELTLDLVSQPNSPLGCAVREGWPRSWLQKRNTKEIWQIRITSIFAAIVIFPILTTHLNSSYCWQFLVWHEFWLCFACILGLYQTYQISMGWMTKVFWSEFSKGELSTKKSCLDVISLSNSFKGKLSPSRVL